MKNIITRKAVLLLLMLLSPGTFAVIIEGAIRGTLQSLPEYEEYLPVEGYWENTELGSEVVGTF